MAATGASVDRPGHRRNKSSSVLRSIIAPKSHKRSPSEGAALNKNQPDNRPYNPAALLASNVPLSPPAYPHSQLRSATWDQNIPISQPTPRKSNETKTSSHKKTLSSVSLRSLGREKDKDKTKERQSRDPSRAQEELVMAGNPKKTKSTTNLTSMFSKNKQPKEPKSTRGRDKENTTPPSSATAAGPVQTPIWAQFSSQTPLQEISTTSKVPLNDRHNAGEDISRYTQNDYSPSKHNFFNHGVPTLQQPPSPTKERSKSTLLSGGASTTSLFDTFSRKKSNDRMPLSDTKGNGGRTKESTSTKSIPGRGLLGGTTSDDGRRDEAAKQFSNATKRANRVMTAVAALNGKTKRTEPSGTSPVKLDPKVVDAEFETVLESRNIPTHQRAQMRTLKLEVKADFVRTHKLDMPQSLSRAASAHSSADDTPGQKSTKPSLTRSAKSHDGASEERVPLEPNTSASSSKRERPRSRTFTFGKGDSPVKKQKAEDLVNDRKTSKVNAIPSSPSTRSLVSNGSQRSSKGPKTVTPDEFIAYMRKTTKPQEVEVGKLHKLRLLLRNETVEWVDTFLQEGGMMELVALLHRIMEVEWREDHEDTLLHEVLRCLKGLSTTDSALKQLADIASTLFPALLAMLFDEEHKGPSDFTTRELIVQLLFAHLSAVPEYKLHSRAMELLKYLKDPVKEKESSTIPFILQMHQPRPYQVWCKEITNVTKEVFWIFIHHLNVVPIPPRVDGPVQSYAKTHFPGPRAIVPAAPYVGGVEWDATNYIATHLDLINGLLASLPSREARNTLRSELKISGFEKLMGHLRACNPKYYGAVHDAVKVWIAAGLDDSWDVRTVRMGSNDGKLPASPIKSPKKAEKPPQIQAPKMDLGLGLGMDLKFDKASGGVGMDKKDDFWN
ncbi:GTPase binding protein Rid1 [Pleomassaria siparia CBS 279.74]|uniref:GTPase binding protein Rid1 n=1 Tax=Pleomassaria siparia CBS 279.74 TaxID=1314801 RepID=A0A6G1JWL7_9PLEO|nr:GTPase binding protein Rid1 [Pleomassaria siparia CBS 279.74]